MPKMKTNKSIAKRFKVSATGKLKHESTNHQHNTGDHKPRRTRRLRKGTYVDSTMEKTMKKCLPYL